MVISEHFRQRWNERGIEGVCAEEVFDWIVVCIQNEHDDVTKVLYDGTQTYYRFLVRGVPFYTMTRLSGVPCTVLTQSMFSKYRKAAKQYKLRKRGKAVGRLASQDIANAKSIAKSLSDYQ